MKKLLIVLLMLAGCSRGGEPQEGGNAAAPVGPAKSEARPGEIGSLVGLYEGGEVSRTNQLCMVEGEGGETRFGLVVWGANLHSCSGSGTAVREGDRIRLQMAGDESCAIEARISGGSIVLPESVPDGCAYYCGADARLTAASFKKVGSGAQEAAKAKDLVGDPLC